MSDRRLRRADMSALPPEAGRLHGAYFSLTVSPLLPPRRSAFTCVVSKQAARKATERNLIKRRCREAVRAHLRTFPALRSLALVFRAKQRASGASFADIGADIDSLFEKIPNLG